MMMKKFVAFMAECDENGYFDDIADEMYQEIERLTVIVAQKKNG